MKKILIMSIFFAFLAFVPHALAQTNNQGFVPLAGIPGLTQGVQATSGGIASFLNNLYKFLIGAAAVLAVIMIIWGGLEIATNRDNVSKILDSKGRIYNAIFGLVLVLLPVLVFSIINPSILNLSIGMSPITAPAGSGGGSQNQNNVTDQASGCIVNGTPGILQIATCPPSGARTWAQSCPGYVSEGPQNTDANGTVTSFMILCTGTKNYVFAQIKSLVTFTINTLQPLAITESNPNNANDAINFANICREFAAGKTCISNMPLFNFSVKCLPVPKTSLPKGDLGGCYNETLSCVPATGFGELALNPKCASNPSWTPFQ